MEFFQKTGYIDTYVQKGGIPGTPGCMEHMSMVSQLLQPDLTNAYGSMPHKLVIKTLEKHHVPAIIRDLTLVRFQTESHHRISNIRLTEIAHGNHHRLHNLSDPVCSGNEHFGKIG